MSEVEPPSGPDDLWARLTEAEGKAVVLHGIDLGRATLLAHVDHHPETPGWWNPDVQGARLSGTNLGGASLGGADLHGADLRQANLQGARLGGANLSEALLEEANLTEADLASANLAKAQLGKAQCTGALLEEADLHSAVLRFANLENSVLECANLQDADLWGVHLHGSTLIRADLRNSTLRDAQLQKADLQGADLRGAVLDQTDFSGANLSSADLEGAQLRNTRFTGASLRECKLQGLDLTGCDLTHVGLSGAWLERTRLHQSQLGGAIGEELSGDFEGARRGYLALERNFEEQGDTDAASWAYSRKRRMQKHAAASRASEAWKNGHRRAALADLSRYIADESVELLCDYGESIPRVLGSLLMIYLVFAFLYGVTGSVLSVKDATATPTVTRHPLDLLIFSLVAMNPSGNPAMGLQPGGATAQLLVGLESLLSIALTGLLGFVVGNRIRR